MTVTFAECLPLGTRQRAATWPAQGHQAGSPLPSATWSALGKGPLCRVPALALGKKIYFFYFGRQFCCEAFLQYHDQHVQIWHIFSTFCYIFSLYFDLLNFFGKCRFELRVHRIFDLNDSKNDILVFECKVRPNPWTDPKFRSTCARGNATIFRAGGFLILKKCKRIPKIAKLVEMSWYRMRMLWSKFEKVSSTLHVRCSQTSTSPYVLVHKPV